jgi:hypothetical protein
MSEDYFLLKHIQHWCLSFETFNETQEEVHFHGELREHLLAVIFSNIISEQDR